MAMNPDERLIEWAMTTLVTARFAGESMDDAIAKTRTDFDAIKASVRGNRAGHINLTLADRKAMVIATLRRAMEIVETT